MKDKNETDKNETDENKQHKRDIYKALSLMTQLGLSMAICVLIGVIGGNFLDNRLGSSPLCLIIGSILGAASSFKVMYDLVMKRFK